MTEKKRSSDHGKKIVVSTNGNGNSREKVEKATKVAVETYKKAMKELERH